MFFKASRPSQPADALLSFRHPGFLSHGEKVMLARTCLLLPKCSSGKKQNPVLLKIYSYEDGVTLWTRMQLFGKNGWVKFKHERDLTSCSVEQTWVAETTIKHFQ